MSKIIILNQNITLKMFRLILWCIIVYIFIYVNYFDLIRYIHINVYPTLNTAYQTLPRVNKRKPVIISITTLPSKIETIKYTLSSILSQSCRVDEIRLYLPEKTRKGQHYIIPKWLKKLEDTLQYFKIRRCQKDWGPGTKIIPALLDEKNNDVYIIYLDDDIVYHRNTVETLVSYSNIYPKCAIANSTASSSNYSSVYKTPIKILEGFSGVIVRPSFFNLEKLLSVENYPDVLVFNDDVYISGLLCENGIERISTSQQRSIPYYYEFINGYIFRSNQVSLSSTVNKENKNFIHAMSFFNWKSKK
jgi:hypothetical protein